MKPEVILGLHGFSANSQRQMHDAGVCLLVNGEVAAAIDEERLTRAKRDGSFPHRSIEAALDAAGVSPDHVDGAADVLVLGDLWVEADEVVRAAAACAKA